MANHRKAQELNPEGLHGHGDPLKYYDLHSYCLSHTNQLRIIPDASTWILSLSSSNLWSTVSRNTFKSCKTKADISLQIFVI